MEIVSHNSQSGFVTTIILTFSEADIRALDRARLWHFRRATHHLERLYEDEESEPCCHWTCALCCHWTCALCCLAQEARAA